MAITINWPTGVISVPKADMTLIQSTPFEIRELDINTFRLALKDLEDDEEGQPWIRTHNHNTTVSVGGVTLARVIEIINGYTITFEDGNYAVNLIGANSNIADVINLNSVSVRAANSAGLANANESQYASFNGGVWIDVNSATAGTLYPSGTEEFPVNNLAGAIIIAEANGFSVLNFASNYTFGGTVNITGYKLIGRGLQITTLTFTSGCVLGGCQIQDAQCTGSLSGIIGYDHCELASITDEGATPSSSDVIVAHCLIGGTNTWPANYSGTLKILDSWSDAPGFSVSGLDFGGSTADFILRNYSGGIKLYNITQAVNASLDFNSGHVILDSTCTNGNITIRGVGKVTDNSTGTTVDTSHLMRIDAVWNALVANYTTPGTTGKALSDAGSAGNPWSSTISGNTDPGTFGELVGTKMLTVAKFLGLK